MAFCGIVSIAGRPNVGKSTLLNQLLTQKISITSRKKQTTRQAIRGIKTQHNKQVVFVDTPGLHMRQCSQLNHYMNQAARDALVGVDLVMMVMEADKVTREDAWILQLIHAPSSSSDQAGKILVINKTDQLRNKARLLPQIQEVEEKTSALSYTFDAIIPVSAFNDEDVQRLQQEVMQRMPSAPFLFPADVVTDLPENQLVAELIREQLIRFTGQELPYQTHVGIEHNKLVRNIQHIYAIIYVEKQGQKPIVLGQNGNRLKQIATIARHNIEKLMQRKVMLRLWIKVKEHWTDDRVKMQQLGYFS